MASVCRKPRMLPPGTQREPRRRMPHSPRQKIQTGRRPRRTPRSDPVPARSDLGALVAALGDVDPVRREGAMDALAADVSEGLHDDELDALGDELIQTLRRGLGEPEGDDVFARSFAALVLACCLDRDAMTGTATHRDRWGTELCAWFAAERDVRGWVPGHGWAHAIAHGADALGALTRSPRVEAGMGRRVLEALLARTLAEDGPWVSGEPDRIVHALGDLIGGAPEFVDRLGAELAVRAVRADDPYRSTVNLDALLRTLHLHRPAMRPQIEALLAQAYPHLFDDSSSHTRRTL